MGDNLMAEEIEIDPLRGAPSFGTSKKVAIELASCFKVIDRKGNMKRRQLKNWKFSLQPS